MEDRYSSVAPLARGGPQRAEEVRVRDVWTAFQTWMRDDQNYAPQTRKGYVNIAQHSHRWLRANGFKGLPWATEENIRAYWDSVAPSASNRRHKRAGLIAFFRFVNKEGWRPDNPAMALPKPKKPRRLPRPIASRDAQKLLDVAETMGPMTAAIVNLLAYTGIRNAELRGLKWADVEGPLLHIIGKGDKERVVPIPPPAMLALVRWRKATQASEWVFPATRHDDRQMSGQTLKYIIDEVSDAACVPVTPHVLRHTYATELFEMSGDIAVVQQALGHASAETTGIYVKVRPTRVMDAVQGMDYSHQDGSIHSS